MRFASFAAVVVMLLSGAVRAEDTAYKLELQINWSEATHAHDWPGGSAHLSGLAGAVHNKRYRLFADGETASSGLELVAETGRTGVLEAEMADAAGRNRIKETFKAPALWTIPGTMTATFKADDKRSRVSFVTMIAPSPDWFTGMADVELKSGGTWAERIELPLWAWDAGTDSGETYKSKNADTQPAGIVRLIASPHFLAADGLKPVGNAVITRVK